MCSHNHHLDAVGPSRLVHHFSKSNLDLEELDPVAGTSVEETFFYFTGEVFDFHQLVLCFMEVGGSGFGSLPPKFAMHLGVSMRMLTCCRREGLKRELKN